MRAAIYVRVSTPEQAEEDRASLRQQMERCQAYCESKGYAVVSTYSDVGSEAALETAIRVRAEEVAKNRDAIERRVKELAEKRSNLQLEQDRVIT